MIYLDPSLLYMPGDVFEASFLPHISRTYYHSWCFTWAVCHHLTSFERNPTQLSIFGFQQIFQVCKFHLHNLAWTICRCTSNTNKVNEWMNFCFVCLQCNPMKSKWKKRSNETISQGHKLGPWISMKKWRDSHKKGCCSLTIKEILPSPNNC